METLNRLHQNVFFPSNSEERCVGFFVFFFLLFFELYSFISFLKKKYSRYFCFSFKMMKNTDKTDGLGALDTETCFEIRKY